MLDQKNGSTRQAGPAHPISTRPGIVISSVTENLRINKHYLIVLLAVTWLGNYLYLHQWGFYEDDWMLLGRYFTSYGDPQDLFKVLLTWPSGRPLGHFFIYLAGLVGSLSSSVVLLYIFGLLILYLNAVLIFFLFKALLQDFHAFLIALFFLLCPLDTTRMFLTHSFFLQLSLGFTLMGMLLISYRQPVAGYAVAALSLLTYETGFLLLVAAPFFCTRRVSIKEWKTYIVHYIISGSILMLYIIVRQQIGDSRIAAIDGRLMTFIWQTLQAVSYDMAHAVRSVTHMYMWAWKNPSLTGLLLAVVILVLVAFLYRRYAGGQGEETIAPGINSRRSIEVLFVALLIMAASYFFSTYLLSEYQGIIPLLGRGTRVHAIASIGYAAIVATIIVSIMKFARGFWPKRIAIALAVLVVGIHVNYAEKIQSDYSRAWDEQVMTFTSIIPLLLDKKPGQIILYDEPASLGRDPMAIASVHWAYNIVLPSIVDWGNNKYLDSAVLVPLARSDWMHQIQINPPNHTLVPKVGMFVGVPGLARMNWELDNITLIRLTRFGYKRYRFVIRENEGGAIIGDRVRYSKNKDALMNRPLQKLATVLFTDRELHLMGLWRNLQLAKANRHS